jgi:hypothetical protein
MLEYVRFFGLVWSALGGIRANDFQGDELKSPVTSVLIRKGITHGLGITIL